MSDRELIFQLRNELRKHNHNYYVLDTPTISDFEFDIKLKKLQVGLNIGVVGSQFSNHAVGGAVTKNFQTVFHAQRMYSLDNSTPS